MIDLGISEGLRKIQGATLGSTASKFAGALARKLENNKGAVLGASDSKNNTSVLNQGVSFKDASEYINKQTGYTGNTGPSPKELAAGGGGAQGDADRAEKNRQAKIRESIGAGWDDADELIGSTGSALNSSKKYISGLGKVRDQYLVSAKNYLDKTKEAIDGNKKLIERNQKEALDDLAGDTRKSVDNTNIMLGIKGATGGSASKAAARAIAQSAGKTRASILTEQGDKMSGQNQAEKNATEEYNTRREQAYQWEKQMTEQAVLDFKTDMANLERLKSKKAGWKEDDLKAESDRNLSKFLQSIAEIQGRAKKFRDNLAARMSEFGGNVDALDAAAVTVDAPAELDTPDFSENIDLTTGQNAEDFFDPNNTGKQRVIKGYDAFGNPIYEDELAAATA
jgi:hypothetical protein